MNTKAIRRTTLRCCVATHLAKRTKAIQRTTSFCLDIGVAGTLYFIAWSLSLTLSLSITGAIMFYPEVGVKVFIIDSASTKNTEEIVLHIRRVFNYVANENCIEPRTGPLGFQRCLLYQDEQGRLFNLMLSKHSISLAATWLEYLESFSGCHAIMAVTVLSRSFPCMANGSYFEKRAFVSLRFAH